MSGWLFALAASGAIRAASLDLCADEYLLLLARPGEVVSVSNLSHVPADSPLWQRARRVRANRGTVEELVALRPTLVITMGGGAKGSRAIVDRLGYRALALPYPETPAEVGANVRRVAAALGDERRAAGWNRRLSSLQRRALPMRDAVFMSDQGQSVSASGLSARWMRMLGLVQRALPGGRMTLEQVRMRPPAVLLLSDYRADQPSIGRRWLDHPWVRKAPSQRLVADGRRWTCGGPLMLDDIERLARSR